jgi:hypothetical protein
MSGETGLITLDGLSKVFYTEEVETHALSNITLEIATGEFVARDRDGRVRVHRGTLGVRQDHATVHLGTVGQSDGGHVPAGR